ncbi:MAG: phosphomannomutase [Gammaproteobacteria bacterium]|nr:phosphomannomutase [Gammaproteobacteria bacterium]MCW8840438.1 phosphomannomutase [Gammaproteobacteria bacterium]MCW8957654.1 phosphomannomutase [Gammaproteobacteria bacterium]MCW8993311.1 phosphomannomutase [Gammaproteobacteria bacterium]
MTAASCFKAYDIRGRIPDELNEDVAYRIGCGYAAVIQPRGPVAVGWDIRQTSPAFAAALIRGLNDSGVDTREIGLCGTEMIYHAAAQPGMGGGIVVTASHNPIDYNGMKLVREQAIPISGDSGLKEIADYVANMAESTTPSAKRGNNQPLDITTSYVEKVLSFINIEQLRPLHLVVNAGNGAAGPALDAIAEHLPFKITRIHHEPDGTFPNGIPNPLLPENRAATAEAVRQHGADMGIAWDGDYDRCFLFDEHGDFIEGYYIVGMLAEQLLHTYQAPQPAEGRGEGSNKIIHDPRLSWNTIELVKQGGGIPVMSKTGHAFIKERMRKEDAIYGGEMSAHHYFRDFAYCDSGMIPWLLVAEYLSTCGKPLSDLVRERIAAYPCSGELNYRVADAAATTSHIEAHFQNATHTVDRTDGLSMDFGTWRFNLRSSNTEPLLRLNVEARGDTALMQQKTEEIAAIIDGEDQLHRDNQQHG